MDSRLREQQSKLSKLKDTPYRTYSIRDDFGKTKAYDTNILDGTRYIVGSRGKLIQKPKTIYEISSIFQINSLIELENRDTWSSRERLDFDDSLHSGQNRWSHISSSRTDYRVPVGGTIALHVEAKGNEA